jgi:hypothetical protein
MEELKQLQSEYLVDPESAVYVTKDAEGRSRFMGSMADRAGGSLGRFWGCSGLLFFVPVALLFGAGLGAPGHFTKIGLMRTSSRASATSLALTAPLSSCSSARRPGQSRPRAEQVRRHVLTTNLPDVPTEAQEALDAATPLRRHAHGAVSNGQRAIWRDRALPPPGPPPLPQSLTSDRIPHKPDLEVLSMAPIVAADQPSVAVRDGVLSAALVTACAALRGNRPAPRQNAVTQ